MVESHQMGPALWSCAARGWFAMKALQKVKDLSPGLTCPWTTHLLAVSGIYMQSKLIQLFSLVTKNSLWRGGGVVVGCFCDLKCLTL